MSQLQSALIVDDDQGLANGLAMALGRAGFVVRTACNGLHGYFSYSNDPTDWVVTDVDMPEQNGIEMMRSIRTINPAVKTIYMTGAVEKYRAALTRESREFSAQVLPKPFRLNELIDQITETDRNQPPKTSVALKVLHKCTELPSDEPISVVKK